jgi:carbamoyltransferase
MKTVQIGVGIDGKGDHNMCRRVIANPARKPRTLEYRTGKSVGRFLAKIGGLMGLTVGKLDNGINLTMDYAGKVMGAQAYGKAKKLPNPRSAAARPYDLLKKMPKPVFKNQKFLNWLATAHKAIGEGTLLYFADYCKPEDCIVYAGGVAQNTVCNDLLYSTYPNLHIPPHCYDGGVSLGCVEFLRLKYNQPNFNTSGFPYWQRDVIKEEPSDKTIDRVASLLADGKIVGWFQGRGEIGPRALGNRSILMHPGIENGKEILNSRVKHREHWRPYAPSVLWEYAQDWFEVDRPEPYMLRTVKVKSNKIPAVTHVDGTSRIQTVHGGLYGKLIEMFYIKTGIPLVLNTSLNAGGKPICATPEQALELYEKTDMDALCVGDKLYEKQKTQVDKSSD